MGKFKGALLIALILCSTILLFNNPFQGSSGVLAYYDDVKGTSGCSIYALTQSVTPTQASMFSATNGQFVPNGFSLDDMILSNNNATTQISIKEIDVNFGSVQGSHEGVYAITMLIPGNRKTTFSTGDIPVNKNNLIAEIIPNTPYIMDGGVKNIHMNINFDGNAKNDGVTVIFIFSDGSQDSVMLS